MGWIAVGDYEVALKSGAISCRNAAGKELKTLPKALKDSDEVLQLRQVIEWLDRHALECQAAVERWLVRSLPVPTALLASVWADESWRSALTDLVVGVCDVTGVFDPEAVGFLRHADSGAVGVVNLDGESVRLTADLVAIPHPVLLPDLPDLQEFAADLKVRQNVDQLFRQTYPKPIDVAAEARVVTDYNGGKFEQLRFLLGRATSLGYQVRGGYAITRVFEAGRTVEARFWLGEGDPWDDAWTGDLVFTSTGGHSLSLVEAGPVAWSEGMRMAAAIHAGRVTEKEGDDE